MFIIQGVIMEKNIFNRKLLLLVLSVILCVLLFCYFIFIFSVNYSKASFTDDVVKIAEQNENPIFRVHKIMLYSNATAIDKSENESLKDLSINQYTDIAIYIDNTSTIYDITNENTVKELYIDNVKITPNSDKGHQYINYKNALDFAKFKDIEEPQDSKISFNIINTNDQNESADYSTPSFYTDCSNPITLEYMNKDIVTNYSVSGDSSTISFNGKVLQEAGINITDLNYSLSFDINIINNLNEQFVCNLKLDVKLDRDDGTGIERGYLYENNTVSGYEYNFFKIVK